MGKREEEEEGSRGEFHGLVWFGLVGWFWCSMRARLRGGCVVVY